MLRDSDQDFAESPDESVTTVEDLMTPDPACVGVDTPVTEIARLMAERRIHRVIVTDRVGIPVGIVTSLDLLEVFPAESAARARAGS
jgi:CBS domain-containing protein